MEKVFAAIRKVVDQYLLLLSALLFLIATLATAYGAVIRTSGLPVSVVWVEEFTRYAMIWATMLIISIGFRKATHTQFTLFEEKLKGTPKHILRIVIFVLTFVMFLLLFLGGISLCKTNASMKSSVMMISMAVPYASIAFGGFVVCLELVMLLIEEIKALAAGGRAGKENGAV